MKPIWQSKTAWLNLIAALCAFFPPVQTWINGNPETAVAALCAVNVLLRFVTSGAVSLSPDGGTNGQSGGAALIWLLAPATAGLLGVLPSCGVSYSGSGKPTFSLDPVALAQLIETWQRSNDAKDSSVIIVSSPAGEKIVATAPDGKVTTAPIFTPASALSKP